VASVASQHGGVKADDARTADPTDINQLLLILEHIDDALDAAGLGRPKRTLADASYCSTANIDTAAETSHDLLVATGRLKHH